MSRVDQILPALTKSIIGYEEGDILLQSEWMDSLRAIKQSWTQDGAGLGLLDGLIDLVKQNMGSGPLAGYVENLSQGMELVEALHAQEIPSGSAAERVLRFLSQLGGPGSEAAEAPEHLNTFLTDATERLSRAQELILLLEKNPGDTETIHELFRIFHTIKGECGFLKIPLFAELTHNIEDLLDRMRTQQVHPDTRVTDLLLEGIDHSEAMIRDLSKGTGIQFTRASLEAFAARLAQGGGFGVTKKKASPDQETGGADAARVQRKAEDIVRVKAAKVTNLVDMIGELINTIGQVQENSPMFTQIRKITRELQQSAMELKTDSARNLLGKIQRSVRDLSKKLDKHIRVEVFGEDLEIDRNLLERLEEPLLHIIRNSVDHGLEPGELRVAAGKPAEGLIRVGARRRGNHIEVSVFDDGKGLDRKRILAKAEEKGLISPAEKARIEDREIHDLIFLDGFSTADAVGYVSGRGVGMGVVKSVVSAAKGRIFVDSEEGRFTRFTLLFPLSMAIVDGVVVRCGRQPYVLPVASVVEVILLEAGKTDMIGRGGRVFHFRDETIPVISLRLVLDGCDEGRSPEAGVIVEASDKKKFLFPVDEVLAKKEVVIKSLGPQFSNLRGISAGTVVAGGGLGLVLDVDELVLLSQDQGAL